MILLPQQLDAWVEPSAVGHKVDLHVPRNKLTSCKKMLEKNGIEFSSMVDDLEDLLNEEEQSNQKNAFASYFDYEKYNTWTEVGSPKIYDSQKNNLTKISANVVIYFILRR